MKNLEELKINMDDQLQEIVLLKQMVQRLNTALSKYHSKDGSSLLEPDIGGIPTSPWLSDVGHLSPLLQEYDLHLNELASQITTIRDENSELKSKCQSISIENDKLHREVKQLLEDQINETGTKDVPSGGSDDLIRNLQAQLELATNEKDESLSMCREAMFQLDKLRHQQQTESLEVATRLRSYEDIRAKNERLEEATLSLQLALENVRNENKALVVTLKEQERTAQANADEIKETRSNFQQMKLRHDEREAEMKSMMSQFQTMEEDSADLKKNYNMVQRLNEQFKQELTDAESKLAVALQSASNAELEVNSLKIEIAALQKTNQELEQKDMDAISKTRDNDQIVETAILSRDSALARVRQKDEELQKMQGVMESLVDDVANRVRTEADRVRAQCNVSIQKLVDDLQTMELERTNLYSEIERLKRDKRGVEEEYERVARQRKDDAPNSRLQDIQSRMLIAERARDDSLINLQAVEDKFKRVKIEHENDRLSWVSKHEALTRTVDQLKRQLDEICHEKMLLLEAVNKHKNEVQKLDTASHKAQLNASKEVAKVRSEVGKENSRLKLRIRNLEDNSSNELQQLHHLLADQQRMTSRWKEESQRCAERYESKIQQYKSELSRAKRRVTELSNRLQKSNLQGSLQISPTPELEETNRNLRARLHETEYKLLSATEKLGQMQEIKSTLTLKDLS